MRLRWVGDSRDYVKWDCVFKNSSGRFVFYLPMLRRNADATCRHPEVQDHFDQSKDLDQFRRLFPNRFAVFSFSGREYAVEDADEYFGSAVVELAKLQRTQSVLIFIDPDTGIEPVSGGRAEHLRSRDFCLVWESLRPRDRLIVYQHASRTKTWRQDLSNHACDILRIEPSHVSDVYYDARLANDVCFLVLEKSEL